MGCWSLGWVGAVALQGVEGVVGLGVVLWEEVGLGVGCVFWGVEGVVACSIVLWVMEIGT